MADELEQQGIEVEIIQIGQLNIHGCIGCGYCRTSEENHCVLRMTLSMRGCKKCVEAEGFILASPLIMQE